MTSKLPRRGPAGSCRGFRARETGPARHGIALRRHNSLFNGVPLLFCSLDTRFRFLTREHKRASGDQKTERGASTAPPSTNQHLIISHIKSLKITTLPVLSLSLSLHSYYIKPLPLPSHFTSLERAFSDTPPSCFPGHTQTGI